MEIVKKGGEIKASDSGSIDAFGRWRSSDPQTLFDSKQIFDNAPLFWDDSEVSGSGTSSVYSKDNARSRLSVSLNTSGKRVRQTFMRFNYQSGKSQLILMTGVLTSGAVSGVSSCIGQFNDDNGLFFKMDGVTTKVVRRTSVTGSPADNEVSQSSWNVDKMDGSGKSGVTLNFTKTQIFIIDYEWLGVGRVRMGFVIDGIVHYCHEFLNANSLTEVYMSTPNLPVRYEIENDGTGAATSLDHICSSVISEGGIQDNGILRYESTNGTAIQANTIGTIYTVSAIRLKTTNLGASIKIKGITMINDTTDDFEWVLLLNPTVASAVTFNDVSNSSIQFAEGNGGNPSSSTLTGGTKMTGGVVKSGSNSGDVTLGIENARLLGAAIDGTRDEIYLGVIPYASGANINGGITWRELS